VSHKLSWVTAWPMTKLGATVIVATLVLVASATPIKAINIIINDAPPVSDGNVLVTITTDQNVTQTTTGEATGLIGPFSSNLFQATTSVGDGGIVFIEPNTGKPSDILTVHLTLTLLGQQTSFEFFSDPELGTINTAGFNQIFETRGLQLVNVLSNYLPASLRSDFSIMQMDRVCSYPAILTSVSHRTSRPFPAPSPGRVCPA
jgi:hypothetical protein